MRNSEFVGVINMPHAIHINEELIPFLSKLPVEILDGIFSTLSPKEAYELAEVCVSFMQASQNYFNVFNKTIQDYFFKQKKQAEKLLDSDPISEALFKENPRQFFLDILNKIYKNLSAANNLQIKLEHAYLILLIICGKEHHLAEFVSNNFFKKSINLSFKKSKTPFEFAIDSRSLEKFKILFITYTKHTKHIPLIEYAVQQDQIAIVRFLFQELRSSGKEPYSKEINIYNIKKFGGLNDIDRLLWKILQQAIELRHFEIVNYCLDEMRDLDPEKYKQLAEPEEQGQLQVTLEEHNQLLGYVLQAAFTNKQFQTVDILIGKVLYLSTDFYSIYSVVTGALISGYARRALEFFAILAKDEYRETDSNEPDAYKNIVNNICAHIINNPTIDISVITDFIDKFAKEIEIDNKNKLVEYVVGRISKNDDENKIYKDEEIIKYESLFEFMLERDYATPGECLCIALKKKNQALVNRFQNLSHLESVKYDGNNLLTYAIDARNLYLVVKIVKEMSGVIAPQTKYLLQAIEILEWDILRFLIDSRTPLTEDCLLKAVEQGSQEIVQFLIEQKAPMTQNCIVTAASLKKLDILNILLDSYISTQNATSGDYDPLLYFLASTGNVSALELLFKKVPELIGDVVIRDKGNLQFLWDITAKYGQWDTFKFLLSRSNLMKDNNSRKNHSNFSEEKIIEILCNILFREASFEQWKIVSFLLQESTLLKDSRNENIAIRKSVVETTCTVFQLAGTNGKWDVVKDLLERSTLLEDFEKRNETPWVSGKLIVGSFLSVFEAAARSGQDTILRLMLPKVPPNYKIDGQVLIDFTAKNGLLDSFRLLLSNPNIIRDKKELLKIAITAGQISIVSFLLLIRTNLDQSFFHATFNGQVKVAQLLIESNANIDGEIFYKNDPLTQETYKVDNCYLWAKTIKDDVDRVNVFNALMERQEAVKYFANDQEGTSIPAVTKLLFYAQTGNIEAFQKCQTIYQLELKDIFTSKGVNPLSKAIKFDQEKFLQFIAETNPNFLKANNFDPLSYAIQSRKWGVVYYFLTNQATKHLWTSDEIKKVDMNAKMAKGSQNNSPAFQANLVFITNVIEWIASQNSEISSDIGSASQKETQVGEKRKHESQKVLSKSEDELEKNKQTKTSHSGASAFWSQPENKMSIDFLNNVQNANLVEESPMEENKDSSLQSPTQVADKNEDESDMDIQKGPG